MDAATQSTVLFMSFLNMPTGQVVSSVDINNTVTQIFSDNNIFLSVFYCIFESIFI